MVIKYIYNRYFILELNIRLYLYIVVQKITTYVQIVNNYLQTLLNDNFSMYTFYLIYN